MGEIEILEYIPKENKVTIKYLNNNTIFKIRTYSILKCQLGELLNKRTHKFKIEIGQIVKDYKRYLVIIDKEYRVVKDTKYKYYKYHCNKCGNEDWLREGCILNQKQGCNACCPSPQKIVLGINTIWDKARWMCDLGVSEEDAKKHTPNCSKKIIVKCPYCGKKKRKTPNDIYSLHSIGCTCGDGTSYPEKILISLLEQVKINYTNEYKPNWSNRKRYDFYFELNKKKYIIEVNGSQHYCDKFGSTLEEQQQNDQYKKELALSNGINYYIELDCRKSDLEWIKNNIINSELNNAFDLTKIDWIKCEEFALSNRIKEVCDYWRIHNEINNEDLTTGDLGKEFNLQSQTIRDYLIKGAKLKWCNYNSKEQNKKIGKRNSMSCCKEIEIFKDEISLGIFNSASELEFKSKELFGTELKRQSIYLVALGKRKQYKGFDFKYV